MPRKGRTTYIHCTCNFHVFFCLFDFVTVNFKRKNVSFSFYGGVIISECVASKGMMNCKGFGRDFSCHNTGFISAFAWKD
jgi:hypothetical protein